MRTARSFAISDTRSLTVAFSQQYVFDFEAPPQRNLEENADLGPSSLTVRFPSDAINDLGAGWTWSSAINIDGTDVDRFEPSGGE